MTYASRNALEFGAFVYFKQIFFDSVRSGRGEILEFVCSKLSSSECLLTILVKMLDDLLDKLMMFSASFRVVKRKKVAKGNFFSIVAILSETGRYL